MIYLKVLLAFHFNFFCHFTNIYNLRISMFYFTDFFPNILLYYHILVIIILLIYYFLWK